MVFTEAARFMQTRDFSKTASEKLLLTNKIFRKNQWAPEKHFTLPLGHDKQLVNSKLHWTG